MLHSFLSHKKTVKILTHANKLSATMGGGATVKQFRGLGYHNFLGDRYQQTDTYQQTDRPTIRILELLRTAKIKCHVTCDMSHVTCHMALNFSCPEQL